MQLKHIEAFIKTVDKGSFSAAAEDLFITQPAVSARIKTLESELGVQLFQRVNRNKIILTKEGEQIYPLLLEGYKQISKAYEQIKNHVVQQERQMTISCNNHIGAFIVANLYKSLEDQFPQMGFSIQIMIAEEIVEGVRDGKVDIGLTDLPTDISPLDLPCIKVGDVENILVCAPDHPLAKKKGPLTMEELEQYPIILNKKDFLTTSSVSHFMKNKGLNRWDDIQVYNLGWIKILVENGLGIAMLQRKNVQEELDKGTLVELNCQSPLPATPYYLIFNPTIPNRLQEVLINQAKTLIG